MVRQGESGFSRQLLLRQRELVGATANIRRGAAGAVHAHQELPETVVELLDVGEHAHPVNGAGARRPGPFSTAIAGRRMCFCAIAPERQG